MFVYLKLGRREAFPLYLLPKMLLYNSTPANLCKVGGPNWYWVKCNIFEFFKKSKKESIVILPIYW